MERPIDLDHIIHKDSQTHILLSSLKTVLSSYITRYRAHQSTQQPFTLSSDLRRLRVRLH